MFYLTCYLDLLVGLVAASTPRCFRYLIWWAGGCSFTLLFCAFFVGLLFIGCR